MPVNFLDRIARSRTVSEASDTYLAALRAQGFENVLYIARFLLPLPAAVLREESVLFDSFPQGYVGQLRRNGHLHSAPWALWALDNKGDIALRDLHDATISANLDEPPHPAIAQATDHRVEAGRVISLKECVMRSHGAVVLNPKAGISHDEAEARWETGGRSIGLMTSMLHLRLATLKRGDTVGNLTTRQRQVLEWSAAGKTVADIATILGLTPATVEKHLRLARHATGADTTAHAIMRAYLDHQIFPHDQNENPFAF